MGNIVKAEVKIVGTRPMLWHKFGPEALPLEAQEKNGVAGNDPTEWERTVLVDNDGQLYIEPTYVFSSCREAAKYTKKGRASLQGPMSATMQVLDNRIYIDRWLPDGNGRGELTTDPDELVYLDVRGVRNPTTKARNVRYRIAASPGWRAEFSILWDKTIVSRAQMEAIVNDSGKLVGLGNGRAIGMGRFELESFTVSED